MSETESDPIKPAKRKHAFHVSAEGAAPATTPKWAPPLVPPDPHEARNREQRRMGILGALLFVGSIALSIAIAIGTNGNTFIFATGPAVAGIGLMLRSGRGS